MPITLVPDEEVDAAEADDETMTEDQARAFLVNVHTPKLDELRAKVPKLKFSELIGLAANPDAVSYQLGLVNMADQNQQAIFMAAALAIGDEIDRRVPVPK